LKWENKTDIFACTLELYVFGKQFHYNLLLLLVMKSRKNSKTHNHLKQYLTAYHTVIFCEVARRQRVSKLSAHSPNVMCFKNAVPKMKRIDSNVFAPGSTVKNIFTYQYT